VFVSKRTFTKLFDPKDLNPAFLKRARDFKIRGSSGKLNIALDGLPEFPALGKDNPLRFGDMHFIDSLERMERAARLLQEPDAIDALVERIENWAPVAAADAADPAGNS